ncbi:cysteine desulfurase family protein [Flavobacterium sp.]|uniref:cysteine desulfurase family protein n=1 Tax=Flavobacterium sp. TaxID=239 RepID=UPI0038FC228B
MKKIYLDNASTTQLRPEVIQEMLNSLSTDYGNPSSTHSIGRNVKSTLELSRKIIAKLINASAPEIIFTSGATEANNWILRSAVKDLGIKRIITSKIEHHAVLTTVQALQKEFNIEVDYIDIKSNGEINISNLVTLLSNDIKTLVSLMHVNNEIGTVLDIDIIGRICKQHNALFHSDMVQSVGKTEIDLQTLSVDFIVASAHKFHGPKGIGFAFVRKNSGLQPMLFGGDQEKGLRPGTEALHQVVGMTKALELSYSNLILERDYISNLKNYLIDQLKELFPDFKIIGNREGFYTILNILLPFSEEKTAMIVFHLDMKGIAVSRGSACQSGSTKPSHVLAEIITGVDLKKPNLRISISYRNTKDDLNSLIFELGKI